MRTRRFAVLALACSALLLSGCALLDPGAPRDADGAVTAATEIATTKLLVGDCFSFVDQSDTSLALVVPCADDHDFAVIGQGSLTAGEITSAGGEQNAISAACAEAFDAFVAAAPEGSKPEQQFIVSQKDTDEGVVTSYHCVSTDAPPATAG